MIRVWGTELGMAQGSEYGKQTYGLCRDQVMRSRAMDGAGFRVWKAELWMVKGSWCEKRSYGCAWIRMCESSLEMAHGVEFEAAGLAKISFSSG